MAYGWWLAGVLLVVLVALAVAYRRLKNELREANTDIALARDKLSSLRQELAEVNARRKKLLAASTQALIIVEKDFKISSANKVAKKLFGKFKNDITLMVWTRQHQLHELVEQTLRGEKMPPVYLNWKDQHLEAHARSIKEKKEVVAVALAVHDVTELDRLSRARRDFVTNISHELRTPLASLQLLAETLLNGALDDREMAYRLVNKIATQIDALSQVAREVLDLSMIESGKAPLKMASFSLQTITQQQIDNLLPQADRKNIRLCNNISDNVSVLVDKTMIGRVLTNLIHNAIKFTDSGEIMVSAHKSNGNTPAIDEKIEGHWIEVSVADAGKGIPPDELPRIFERFYKIDPARNRQNSGTGLGLAIAKHIVEGHGGHIWAESEYKVGTTFHFTLPTDDLI